MADGENFEFVSFSTADEFLASIVPLPRIATGSKTAKFIFRGQGNACWSLTPSALRKTGAGITNAVARISESEGRDHADWQAFAEFRLLDEFFRACDRAVIAIPGDSHEFRRTWMDDQRGLMETMYKFPEIWPRPEHYAALAFAQHHGIPTRLLDWSHSALVAAYFAAADAVNLKSSNELAVWVLNTESLRIYDRIEKVDMPGANSARLGAQRGLFTLIKYEAQRGGPVDGTTVVEALVSKNENPTKPKPLWKLTLPRREASRLLYLCHLYGVDGSTVYPGPAGAAQATLERMEWVRADPDTGLSASTLRAVATIDIKSQRPQ